MQSRSVITGIAAAMVAAGMVACGSSDATSPTGSITSSASFQSEVTPDLAPSAGADIASDYQFFSGADNTGGGGSFSVNTLGVRLVPSNGVAGSLMTPVNGTVASATWISPSCTFSSSTQRFACPAVTKNGQTYTTSYQLFDVSGSIDSVFSRNVASINFIVADTGATSLTDNGNTFADTTYRLHNRTVVGLYAPDTVHTWNGNGTGMIHSWRTGQISKVYEFAATDTATNVAFKQPRDINPYPLSGQFVRNYIVTRLREASDTTTHTATRRVVVTFNGTANVPVTIDTAQYMLNLDTRKMTKQ